MLEPTPPYGGNAEFLDALYEQFLRDPASVDLEWRAYFEKIAPPAAADRPHAPIRTAIAERAHDPPRAAGAVAQEGQDNAKQAAVSRLIQIWINRGHLIARLDPLGL